MAELTTNSPFCGINCQFRGVTKSAPFPGQHDDSTIWPGGVHPQAQQNQPPACCLLQRNVVLSVGRKCPVYLEGTLSSRIFFCCKKGTGISFFENTLPLSFLCCPPGTTGAKKNKNNNNKKIMGFSYDIRKLIINYSMGHMNR
jgi:hypothetical protein